MPYNPIKLCFSPLDSRWSGSQRLFFPLFLAKIVVYIALLVLCIVEAALFKKWAVPYWPRSDPTQYADFWVRWAGILIIPEGIHILTQVLALTYNAYHPITAITTSCVYFCLWIIATFFNAFLSYSSELSFPENNTWGNICYGEAGLQGLGALLYVGMIVFSGIAVHKYRKEKALKGVKADMKMDELRSDSV